MPTRYIPAVADATALANVLETLPNAAGIAFKRDDNTLGIWDPDANAASYIPIGITLTAAQINALLQGAAAGYKIARGVHQQAAATDTVVSGLTTVVAVVVSFRDTPTVKQLFVYATIGDQAGSPAAGSFNISTKKPTAVNDVTPTAATDFTDNINFNWIAIGT